MQPKNKIVLIWTLVLTLVWAPATALSASQSMMMAATHTVQIGGSGTHELHHNMNTNNQCSQHDACDFQCCGGCPTATTALHEIIPSTHLLTSSVLHFSAQLHSLIALALRERPPRLNA